jgi:hypothetical protein
MFSTAQSRASNVRSADGSVCQVGPLGAVGRRAVGGLLVRVLRSAKAKVVRPNQGKLFLYEKDIIIISPDWRNGDEGELQGGRSLG